MIRSRGLSASTKCFLILAIVWFFLFIGRVLQIGGIDQTYRNHEVKILASQREYLVKIIKQSLPYPQSALLSGIVLGDGKQIPFQLKQDLKTTSTIHIAVVSGQNLTILAGFIMSLVGFLGRRKTILLTVFVIVIYSLLTGLGVPVIRAAIMAILAYVAQILGKERTGWWVLVLTAGLMLVYNPNWLVDISFQLSFLATLGVVVVAPILTSYLASVPQILRQDLATTLSAQALVLPILAFNFYQISLVGMLANLFVLWTVPIIMVGGLLGLVFGIVSPVLGKIVDFLPSVLLTYFIDIVKFFAKWPGSTVIVGDTAIIIWVGYYLLIGAGIWMLALKKKN